MHTVIEDESFTGEDWYAEDLADRRYVRCVFSDIDLTESTSRATTFEACVFRNVRFNASRHSDSAFLRCQFHRCNLFEAEFTGCKLVGSVFRDSALRPMRVAGGDWSFVTLAGADLRGVNFTGVRMREADLGDADCTGAVLTGLDLSGARLERVRLTRADLRDSDLTALDPMAAALDDAIITPEQAITIAQRLGLRIA